MSVGKKKPNVVFGKLLKHTLKKPMKLNYRSPIFIIFVVLIGLIGAKLAFSSFAGTNTVTYSGRLGKQKPSVNYTVPVSASGTATAQLSYSKITNAKVTLVNPSGAVVATGTGVSPINISAPVSSGNYQAIVSGNGTGNFTITINYPTPDDTTAPSLAITSPVNASTVSATTTISGTASDDVAIAKVEVAINGGSVSTGYQTASGTNNWSYAWDTTKVPNGSYVVEVKATDTANNANYKTITLNVNNTVSDTTPPTTPTGLTANPVSSSQINLTWSASTDNVTAQTALRYQVIRNSVVVATTAPGVVSYQDTGLQASTTYTYTVKALDQVNNVSAASSAVSAMTQGIADSTPPTVTITNPNNGSTVANTITITGTASDNNAVSKVEISFDNSPFQSTIGTPASWSYNWDTKSYSNGNHTITVKATDSSSNISSASVTVNINNVATIAPTVSITSPSNNTTIRGATQITGTTSSDVSSFALYVSGNGIQPFSLARKGTTSWTSAINSIALPAGTYTLTAKVSNASSSATASITFVVAFNYVEPTVAINTPVANATVSGVITVTGTASSQAGVTSTVVQLVGGSGRGEVKTATGTTNWSTSFDTTKYVNGNFSITVFAHDEFGYNQGKTIPIVINNNTGTGDPVVSITSPYNGATVSGTVTMSGTASGANLTFLAVTYPGANWNALTGVSNWTYQLDTKKMPNGLNKVTVYSYTIRDGYQYSGQAQITVNVNNPAVTAAIASPAANSTVSGNLTISGTASDSAGLGVNRVLVKIDGVEENSARVAEGTTNWRIDYNSYGITNGLHTVTVTAYNKYGTPSSDQTLQINVQNGTPPTPASNCTLTANTLPLYEKYISPDGRTTIQICSLDGAWTGRSVYETLKSVAIHNGLKGSLSDPDWYDKINILIQPNGAPGNGAMSCGYSGSNNTTYGASYGPLSCGWSTGGPRIQEHGYHRVNAHEFMHMWSFGAMLNNTANWTEHYPGYQPYGYPGIVNLTRIIGANGDPTLKANYEVGDANDIFADSAGPFLYERDFSTTVTDMRGTGIYSLPGIQSPPGWFDFIVNKWW